MASLLVNNLTLILGGVFHINRGSGDPLVHWAPGPGPPPGGRHRYAQPTRDRLPRHPLTTPAGDSGVATLRGPQEDKDGQKQQGQGPREETSCHWSELVWPGAVALDRPWIGCPVIAATWGAG